MSSYATPPIPPCLNGLSCLLLSKRRLSKGLLLSSSCTEFTMLCNPSSSGNSVGPNILLVSWGVSSTSMASWNSSRDESSRTKGRFLCSIFCLERPASADEGNKSVSLLVTSVSVTRFSEPKDRELRISIGVGMSKFLTDVGLLPKILPDLLALLSSPSPRLRLGSEATVTCWTVLDLNKIQT